MRSFLAALRTLVLPYGATSGPRIILDGVNGEIRATTGAGSIVLSANTGTEPSLDWFDANGNFVTSILYDNGSGRWFFQGVSSNEYFDSSGVFLENAAGSSGVRFSDSNGYLYHGTISANDDWTVPSFSNGWTGSNFGYKRFPDGYVRFRGALIPGTRTGGTTVFTLPAGFRPLVTGPEYVCSWSGGSFWNKFACNTDGTVKYWDGSGGGNGGFVDNIGFSTI